MIVTFADRRLEALYTTGKGARRYPPEVVKAFSRVVRLLQVLHNSSELYTFKGLRPEKLKGRSESSIRLNRQFRLIFTIKDGAVVVHAIEDYH